MSSNRSAEGRRRRPSRDRISASTSARQEPPHWDALIEVDDDSSSDYSEVPVRTQRPLKPYKRPNTRRSAPRKVVSINSSSSDSSSEDSEDHILQYLGQRRKSSPVEGSQRGSESLEPHEDSELGGPSRPISISSGSGPSIIDLTASGSHPASAHGSRSTPSPFEECFSPVLSPGLTKSYESKEPPSATMYRRRSPSDDSDFINDGDDCPLRCKRRRLRLNPTAARPERVLAEGDGMPRVEGAVWPKCRPNTVRGIATVICDACGGSAHFACAGLDNDDDIGLESWKCPDCEYLQETAPNATAEPRTGQCIRPNCVLRLHQAIEREEGDELEFMLKGIIGAKIDPSNPSKKMYLVEWAGVDAISGNPWKLEDSTWEPSENIHNLSVALSDFAMACMAERLPIHPSPRRPVILLTRATTKFDSSGELLEGCYGWQRHYDLLFKKGRQAPRRARG